MSSFLWFELFIWTHQPPVTQSVISQERKRDKRRGQEKEQDWKCVCTHTWRGGGEEWEEREEKKREEGKRAWKWGVLISSAHLHKPCPAVYHHSQVRVSCSLTCDPLSVCVCVCVCVLCSCRLLWQRLRQGLLFCFSTFLLCLYTATFPHSSSAGLTSLWRTMLPCLSILTHVLLLTVI